MKAPSRRETGRSRAQLVIVSLVSLALGGAACGSMDGTAQDPAGGNFEVQVTALTAAEQGISSVRLDARRSTGSGPASNITRLLNLVPRADGSASGRLNLKVLPGAWSILGAALDTAGNVLGSAQAQTTVQRGGPPAKVNLVIMTKPTGTLQVGGTVCARTVVALGAEASVPLAGTINVNVVVQGAVSEVVATLVSGSGAALHTATLNSPDGTSFNGSLPAPGQEGLAYVEVRTVAAALDVACRQQTDAVVTFVDDPATQDFAQVATRRVTGYVNERTGTLVQYENEDAFARLTPSMLRMDEHLRNDGELHLMPCGGPGAACGGPGVPACGAQGGSTQGMPADYGAGYRGSATGGCDVWATLMCNRVLGIDGDGDGNVNEPVDAGEWNGVSQGSDNNGDGDTTDPGETAGVDENGDGNTSPAENVRYYEQFGYTVTYRLLNGAADYAQIATDKAAGADVKLIFARRLPVDDNGDGVPDPQPDANGDGVPDTHDRGHAETVTGTVDSNGDGTADGVTTNSWGQPATISGGGGGGFTHSEGDGAADGDGTGDNWGAGFWPAGGTDVWVKTVQ
jgi:hypothetical protein